MAPVITQGTLYLAAGIKAFAGLLIGLAVIETTISFFFALPDAVPQTSPKT